MGHRYVVREVVDEVIAKIETNTQADCSDCVLIILIVVAAAAAAANATTFIDDVHHDTYVSHCLQLECCYFYLALVQRYAYCTC